jgi:hypothetical protein
MKKYLSIIVGLMLVLGASPVFAVNELTLQTDTQISAGSETFTVLGNYTVDSITVSPTNFTVTLAPGVHLRISAASRNRIEASQSNTVAAVRTCNDTVSEIELVSNETVNSQTLTITPSTTLCTDASQIGGGGGYVAPVVEPVVVATTSAASTSESSTGSSSSTSDTTSTVSTATSAVTAPVVTTTVSVAAPVAASTVSSYTFTTPLALGSKEASVTELQKRLTSEGVYSGPITGYFGSLTLAAVKKYQENNGISKAGQAGYGNVGPATRAKLNASVGTSSVQTSSASIESLQAQLQALQAQLLLLLNQQLQLLKAN